MRTFFLVLFPLLLAIYGAGMLYQYAYSYDPLYENSYVEIYRITNNVWAAFVFLFLGRLFYKGTFRRTVWARFAYVGAGCIFLGMLFRIQHWPMGKLLFLAGTGTIGLSYIIHFFMKKPKKTIDVVKLIYVSFLLILVAVKQMHYAYSAELSWITTVACLVLFVFYYIEEWKGPETEKINVAEEGTNIFLYPDEQQTTS